jgi:hypothetical protein
MRWLNTEREQEAVGAGCAFFGRSDADADEPERETVWRGSQITKPRPFLGASDVVSDGAARLGRWQRGSTRRQRPQRRRSRAGASRDGPSRSGDDDENDLTAFQRAHLGLLETLCTAAEDGPRTYRTLLEVAAIKVAPEFARLSEASGS